MPEGECLTIRVMVRKDHEFIPVEKRNESFGVTETSITKSGSEGAVSSRDRGHTHFLDSAPDLLIQSRKM